VEITSLPENKIKGIMERLEGAAPASQVIRVLSQQGGMSAAQLARATGLARSTISMAVNDLKAEQIVVELADIQRSVQGAGRPGTTLTLNPDAGTCIGIHLGIEDIQIVVADMAHSFLAEETISLGMDYEPDDVLPAIRKTCAALYRTSKLPMSGLLGVGVSVSGPVRPDGVLLRGGILPKWAGINIKSLFETAFRRPVIADNESNCAALAEMKWGAARGVSDFVIFKMDMGVGGAIVSNGKLVTGVAGGAGEFGHVSINPEGELCRCGNRGCLELYASFARPLKQLSRVHKRRVTMEQAIALAESGDAGALRLIADAGAYGGRGLAMIGTILNPPLILVGGRMALAGDLLLQPMRHAHAKHALLHNAELNPESRTVIRVGKFPERDSLLGAVGLVLDQALVKGVS
jgi:predicted NBD/HSP70 family sugar kinase